MCVVQVGIDQTSGKGAAPRFLTVRCPSGDRCAMDDARQETDRFYECLRNLATTADANIERWNQVKKRSEELRAALDRDPDLPKLIRNESPPRVVELLSANIAALTDAGGALRRAEASALRSHGLSLTEIGELFGVSRQRISELL